MPLQKLQFRPGVNKESTTLANEGGWYYSDKIRFRSGFPEKIGGWVLDPGTTNSTLSPTSQTVTLTVASPCVVTLANPPANGVAVTLSVSSGGALPTGLTAGTTYYIINATAYSCNLAATVGGTAINTSGYQAGTITMSLVTPVAFFGVARTMWNWLNLSGYNLLAVGTNLKYYIQNGAGGAFNDVTPLRVTGTTSGAGWGAGGWSGVTTGYPNTGWGVASPVIIGSAANAFSATAGSNVITITQPGHGAQTGDFVTFAGAVGLGGNITADVLNAEFQITYLNSSQYTINTYIQANSSDSGNGGQATTASYQLTTGSEVFTIGVGWGAGGWGGVTTGYPNTGWGSAAPAGLGIGIQLRLWSQSNYGQNLIMNPRGGALYYWVVGADPNTFNIAQILSSTNTNTQDGIAYWQTDTSCPSVCNYVLVSDASRFTIAFGCNDYGSSVQDPLLVRWSDQNNNLIWFPQATNQAGSYQLSRGSTIITAIQTRQEILVLTDAAIYSMQYLGAPYVWGFQIMGDNISIISPQAATTANNITYWMGVDKFYMYSGRVETLPCSLRQYIYDDINLSQAFQVVSGTNEGYNEIWWYYCSANSTTIDRYVIFNHLERTWYYGTLARTAWLDSPLRAQPMGIGYGSSGEPSGALINHETGVNDGSINPPSPIDAYVQSSDFDIGDGHNFGFVWRLIPDVTFDGSAVNAPSLNFTVLPRTNPGANYGSSDNPAVTSTQNYSGQTTYAIQQFTQQVYVRIRGRQMAFRVESNTLGTQWQLGTPRIDVRPDGRR